jgi:hypothetical protein
MKSLAVAVVAVAFAAPAFAADIYAPAPISDPIYAPVPMAVVGHLDLGIGFGKFSEDSEGYGLFEGAGRANIPFQNGWNLEVETGGGAGFYEGGYSSSTIGAAAHLWNRGPIAALGIFGGVSFGGGTLGFIGVEGEVDISQNATLGAQGSFGFGQSDFNYWNVRGWGSYYFSPNTKLRGEVAYTSTNYDENIWDLSAELEHRFTGTAFSAFGKVGYTNISDSGYDSNAWRGLVGARIFLDQPGTTLRDHDRQVPWDVRPLTGGMRQAQ